MKPLNFILTGVGGQGILLSSDILCLVGMAAGYDVKKTDVHGMAQRGGSVISHVRLADQVFSPMVPVGAADYLLSFEKLEACRWLHYLRRDGVVVTSDEAIPTLALEAKVPYPNDAAVAALLAARAAHVRILPAGRMAAELGNPRVANVILLGALSRFVEIPADAWLNAIAERVPPKFRELNRRAFEVGRADTGGA
jgi:indolepyruvate ferredoxin oxidoreductase beta subunit